MLLVCALFSIQSMYAQGFYADAEEVSGKMFVEVQEENASSVNKWDYFMYPVPASSELNVKITRGEVNITAVIVTNELGDEIIYLKDQDVSRLKLDINDLKPGQYYIRIVTDTYATPKMKRFYVSK